MKEIKIFLSFSSEDDDGFVGKFADELKRAIRIISEDELEARPFYSTRDVQSGIRWPAQLAEELNSSHIFMPLCSPDYFRSPWCSKEWGYFRDRLHLGSTPYPKNPPPLILPIHWRKIHSWPALLDEINIVRIGNEGHKKTLLKLVYAQNDTLYAAVSHIAEEVGKVAAHLEGQDLDRTLPKLNREQELHVEPAFDTECFKDGKPRECWIDATHPDDDRWAPFDAPVRAGTWAEAARKYPRLRAALEIERFNFRVGNDWPLVAGPAAAAAGRLGRDRQPTADATAIFLADGPYLDTSPDKLQDLSDRHTRWPNKRRIFLRATPTINEGTENEVNRLFPTDQPEPTYTYLQHDNIEEFSTNLARSLQRQWRYPRPPSSLPPILPSGPAPTKEPDDGR